jgi:hypothetical protein
MAGFAEIENNHFNARWTVGEKDTYDYRLKEIQKAQSEPAIGIYA